MMMFRAQSRCDLDWLGFWKSNTRNRLSLTRGGGRTRADTWTWHHGRGRGIVWRDREREILWLLCFADQHDGGYDLGHALVSEDPARDELYPKLDPEYPTFGFSTAPWGEHQDEDALEWTRFVAGAAEFFDDRKPELDAGAQVDWEACGLIRVAEAESLIKMTIRRQLVYSTEAADRDRYLSDLEIEDLFLQLTNDLDKELWEGGVPVAGGK